MPGHGLGAILAVALLAVGLAACATATPTPVPVPISLDNGTTIPITVTVNGTELATEPAGGVARLGSGGLPERPWTVEARTPTGRVLLSITVGPRAALSDQSSVGDVAFLSCGEIALWAGGPRPDAPHPMSASPITCE